MCLVEYREGQVCVSSEVPASLSLPHSLAEEEEVKEKAEPNEVGSIVNEMCAGGDLCQGDKILKFFLP